MTARQNRKRQAVHALIRFAQTDPVQYERLVAEGELKQDMTDLADVMAPLDD